MTAATDKIPATIITGFLGAGKTTLVRHLMANAGGRRIAIIVNEFGALGIDGETLRACGIEGCEDENIVELANGCICCTVAEDFLPTMEALLDRARPPEHILIETSGLALPKPLIKAFNWPGIRSRVTVDGVVTVVDGPAVADGRFADDPVAVAAQRAADPSVDHDNPLAEVYEDQLLAADLVVLNKADLLDEAVTAALLATVGVGLSRSVKVVPAHHDALDGAHEHDDFESFVLPLGEAGSPEALVERLRGVAEAHDVLRMKGFAAVAGKPLRLSVQGVGGRFRHQFDRPWAVRGARQGRLVVIGRTGLDRAAIAAAVAG